MKKIHFPIKAHTTSRYYDRYLHTAGIGISSNNRDVTLTIIKKNGAPGQFEITVPNDQDTLLTIADALATIATSP